MSKSYKPLISSFILAALVFSCRKTDIHSANITTGLLSKVVYLDTTLPHPFDTVSCVEYFFDSYARVSSMNWSYSYPTLQGFPQSYRFKLRKTDFIYTGLDSLPYMSNTTAYIKQNYPDPYIVDNTDYSTILFTYDNTGRKIADSMTNWYGYNKIDYRFTYYSDKIVTHHLQYRVPLPKGRDTAFLMSSGYNILRGYQLCYFGIDNFSFVSRDITYDNMLNPFNRLNIASALYYAPPFNAVTFQGPEIYQPFYFNKNNFNSQTLYSIYIAFYYPGPYPFMENEYSYTYQYTADGFPSLGYFTNIKHLNGGGTSTTIIKALYTYK